ncbi:MAG: transcription elongation factor Spt5 [Candidatus Thermoplasmatota archaeon]|jgi:transcriptional antiterminator NusG|nr:transcription elongation factor Spt5 [Candidatus Thermoplasmatota archaeon]MCL5793788.1 transcription elongation factor Spt5 [Candidatus Thermoplasmatota archaeon]
MAQETVKQEWFESESGSKDVGCGRTYEYPMTIRNTHATKRKFNISIGESFRQRDEAVEWSFSLETSKTTEFVASPKEKKEVSETIEVEGDGSKRLILSVITPRGGFNDDQCVISIDVQSEDKMNSVNTQLILTLKPVIVAIKTTVGNEFQVSVDLSNRSQKDKEERNLPEDVPQEVISLMSSKDLKGYVFLETMHPDRVAMIAKGIRGYKGLVDGTMAFTEIVHYLTPKPAVTGLDLGALVEIINGPFKGEKAKIMSIDMGKEEVTVQLIESMVPIPLTLRAEAVKILEQK